MDLEKNKTNVLQEISRVAREAGRSPEDINIIAVTKYVDLNTTKEIIALGIKHIGENRVDKFLAKYEALSSDDIVWHFIGSLQRRKVKEIINKIDYFHALDSLNLAKEIQKRAEHPVKCFLQVNISGEESKHGFSLEDIDNVINTLIEYDNITIVGIMTMAPIDASDEQLTYIFKTANELRLTLKNKELKNMPFTDLSMGMSRDYKIAIQNDSTYVRIGTAFFS
ncbi:YggS family pyridoxal phosphate-dependent enzyme [Streptococcus zalophi]|uniref:Pyridoxal phosphate homeostasis protein n=1 Tax=Streptococcus zalophi TaxID=640031 RepID=A0A934UDD3_9STRE|nr:YggS family pyridoxal phosphate-dependent enzyme [Streptococcus zalophi]MBJ8349680.1 YggS family pyridoxal phosphate-dependent enzyme [Streptococcus zalophi]MCR8967971.1 YggS family pyridoxal phosphate-dependent enzyme [Streptococcus zalophi]